MSSMHHNCFWNFVMNFSLLSPYFPITEAILRRCESCHGQAERLLDSAKEMEDSIAVNLRFIFFWFFVRVSVALFMEFWFDWLHFLFFLSALGGSRLAGWNCSFKWAHFALRLVLLFQVTLQQPIMYLPVNDLVVIFNFWSFLRLRKNYKRVDSDNVLLTQI